VQSAYIIIYTGTRNPVASLFFPLRALFTCAVQPRLPPASGGRRPRFLPSGTTRVTSHMDADGGGQDAGAHVCTRQRRMFFLIISVMRRQLLLTPCFSNLPCAIFWACIVDRPMSFKNRRRETPVFDSPAGLGFVVFDVSDRRPGNSTVSMQLARWNWMLV
jgi:hypothetical protein